jgi:hypothetical protein
MKPSVCAVCDENTGEQILNFGRLNGVFYCNKDECCKKIKKDMIEYINETMNIPLYGLIDRKTTSYDLKLSFFRKTKKTVFNGTISKGTRNWFCIRKVKIPNDKKIMVINLEYKNIENKDAKTYSRSVELNNIMFHNKDFYNKLSNCNNLFDNDDIVISFEELSDEIRNIVYMYYIENLNKESSDFEY